MLSRIILNNDLHALKKRVKNGYKIDNKFYVYDAIKTLDCDMIDYILSNTTEKNNCGEVYFYMIDSYENITMDDKVNCFKIILKYFPRPKQAFDTIIEIDNRINEENKSRLYTLYLVALKKGKYHCLNMDIIQIIKEFL